MELLYGAMEMIALQILSWIQRSMRGFLFNKWDVSRSNSQKSGEGNFHWSFSSTILCTYTPHLLWRVGEPLEQCKKWQQRAVGGTDFKKCVPLSIQGNLQHLLCRERIFPFADRFCWTQPSMFTLIKIVY